ncbi:MAG: ATP-binding cassette domain-containing protein [Magnetococcales bacterium]|nr:ATP-binding cassette domain-containing protein [Magnetococcales bacterium]
MKKAIQEDTIKLGSFSGLWIPGVTSFIINLLGLLVPLALIQVYNRILPNHATQTLSLLVLGVLVALVVEAALRSVRAYHMGWMGARFEHQVSCNSFRRLLYAAPEEIEKADGSKFMEGMNAINQVGELYSGQALMALFDLPFLVMYLFLVYLLAGPLALVPLGALILISVPSAYVGFSLKKTLKQDMDQKQRRYSFITETLDRIHSVKALAMESLLLRRHEMLLIKGLRQTYDLIFLGAIMPAFSSFTAQGMTAMVIAFGAIQVIDGDLTTGGLAACTMLAGRSLQPIQALVAGWTRLQAIRMARQEVNALLTIPQRENLAEHASGEPLSGAIQLQNISFEVTKNTGWQKPGEPPPPVHKTAILTDISLTIDPGECIGIVGDSGSGKSTFLKLITGAAQPTQGTVRIDSREVHLLPQHLSAQIGYIPQKGTLFNGTILQNLTMFDDTRQSVALTMAARLGLDAVVARMPKGYHTVVGDGAQDTLPAGVQQRIVIARILAREPKILLFDEANMAIDSAGDNLLRTCLENMKGECSIILISQRPSLLRMADRVFRLQGGTLHLLEDLMDAFRVEKPSPTLAKPVAHPVVDPGQGPEETLPQTKHADALALLEQRRSLSQEQQWQLFLDQMHVQTPFSRCLKGLLTAMSWKGTARQLAESVPHLSEKLDLTNFCSIMANLHHVYREARGKLESIDPRLMPFLFVSNKGRVVVALGRPESGATEVIDGDDGERKVVHHLGAGRAYLFSLPGAEAITIGSWVRSQLQRFQPLIWTIMGITILGNIMGSMTPLFVMAVYGQIIPSGAKSMALVLLVGLLLALLVDVAVRVQRVRLMAYIGSKAERTLSSGILDRILALPAAYTERVSVGVQVARIRTLEVIREMLTGPLAYLYYDAPTSLFYMIVLGIINPSVIFFMLLLILGLVLVGFIILPVMRVRSSLSTRLGSHRQAFLTEALHRLPTIQGVHAQEVWYDRYRDLSGKATLANFRLNQVTALLGTMSQTITMAAALGVMSMTAQGVMEGKLTSGAVMAAMLLTWRIFGPVQTTFLGIAKMVQVFNSMTQTDRLMEIKGEREIGAIAPMGRTFQGEVVFNRVSFRYRNDADPALIGVSFRVPAGSVVTVIGANGSGKSTLLKMILGLYTPQAGSILIDNGDIRQTDPLELRQGISYLPQTCDIFFGTVAQNLRLVNPDASDAELEAATARAGLLDEIKRLPKGFDTRLQESGDGTLSSGFRQRLSLARVYLKSQAIMLYDEPGNNLDAESERLFLEAVNELRGKSTVFIVTHRPSHLKIADLVLYMEGGYLRAAGTPAEVSKILPNGFV